MRTRILPCLLILLLTSSAVWALEPPKLTERVMDLAGLLSVEEKKTLILTLKAHEKASTQQFAVLTVPSLEGDSIEDFSIRTVEAWKLGTKEEDNGLLLVVAKADRKMRIEVGYGLEGEVTDLLANRIISNVMRPAFRQGNFAEGIQSAVDMLILAATGQAVNIPDDEGSSNDGSSNGDDDIFFIIGLIFFLVLFKLPALMAADGYGNSRLGKSGRGWGSSYGSSSSFGGGSGGFSGGGGSFGGGGASGGW